MRFDQGISWTLIYLFFLVASVLLIMLINNKMLMYTFLAFMCLLASTHAHLTMLYPCPFNSPNGKDCPALPPGAEYDYDLNSPISSVTLNTFTKICRKSNPWTEPAAQWKAGETVTFEFTPDGAAHSGGHLELAVSYDEGKQWVVLKQVLQYAFVGRKPKEVTNNMSVTSYDVDLPSDLPSGDNVYIAFFWVNASGNREFYNACSIVSISGSTSTSFTGKAVTYANMPGEPTIPEFNGDYESGIDLYTTKAKFVTVTADGKTTSAEKPPNYDLNNSSGDDNDSTSKGDMGSKTSNKEDSTSTKAPNDLESEPSNKDKSMSDNVQSDLENSDVFDDKCNDEPSNSDTILQSRPSSESSTDSESSTKTELISNSSLDSSEPSSETFTKSSTESSTESSMESSTESSSESFSESSAESSPESPSESPLESSTKSSDPSELGDLDTETSESPDTSPSSSSSSTNFAYPVMPTYEPGLMHNISSNSPAENFYMQNNYASYGYLTETSVADAAAERSSSEEPGVDVAIDMDDKSGSSSTESPEPTSSDVSSYNKYEYSQFGDENNNVVNISLN